MNNIIFNPNFKLLTVDKQGLFISTLTCIYFKNADTKIVEEMDRIQFKLDTKTT